MIVRSSALPESASLKSASPYSSRSLAPAAWFYEQLAECRGTSVASPSQIDSSPPSVNRLTPQTRSLHGMISDPNEHGSHSPKNISIPVTLNERDLPWNVHNFPHFPFLVLANVQRPLRASEINSARGSGTSQTPSVHHLVRLTLHF